MYKTQKYIFKSHCKKMHSLLSSKSKIDKKKITIFDHLTLLIEDKGGRVIVKKSPAKVLQIRAYLI